MGAESLAELGIETAASRALWERLQSSLPGGDTRTGTTYAPYPIAFASGAGFQVRDLDGNQYIDLCNNMSALVHGHAHPAVTAAIVGQAQEGTAFPAPNPIQGDVAERLCERIASVDRVRFTNSGTEAAMQAVRTARAYTARDRIIKVDGGYHGSWEQVPMSFDAPHGRVGSALDQHESSESWALGTPKSVGALVDMVTFNDVAGLEAAAEEHGSELAAIILEPVLGVGMILGDPRFFRRARQLADEHGALLILDEVITARLAWGGYQDVLGVQPDLSVFGKLIGGGLPVGAFGGRSEVMDLFDPNGPRAMGHAGTFNGNPMTLVAGRTALDLLTDVEITRINQLGEQLADELRRALTDCGLPGRITGYGSLLHIHFDVGAEIQSFSDMNLATSRIERFHRLALAAGIFLAPRGMIALSTPMNPGVVDEIVVRCRRALTRLAAEG